MKIQFFIQPQLIWEMDAEKENLSKVLILQSLEKDQFRIEIFGELECQVVLGI